MRKLLSLVAGLVLAGGVAAYAGMWSGLPAATSSPTTASGNATTLPLTGNEVSAFDTGLSAGRNPQTETISIDQIKTYVFGNGGTAGLTGNTTATATAGASTCNAARCVVTTESLTTAIGASSTQTISSTNALATSIPLVSLSLGTNVITGAFITTATAAAGAVSVIIKNGNATSALSGTMKINLVIVN